MWHRCETLDDVKELFKKLAFRLHPDQGGSHELMILLQESYEFMKKKPNAIKEFCEFSELLNKGNHVKESPKKYQNVIEDVPLGSEKLEILREIFAYAELNTRFDTSYVESICEFCDKNKYITSNQYNALVNIYYSFKMNEK